MGPSAWYTPPAPANSRPALPRYRSTYTYDANGNITAAERWDRDGNKYDQFSYKYAERSGKLHSNRLYQLNDLADAGNLLVNEANGAKDIGYTGDVPFVAEATTINEDYNYRYDQLGNLIKDDREGIANIQWTVAGKVKQVEKTDGTVLTFAYGADGQRLWKEVTPPVLDDTGYREYYIRDAQGNIMATYRSQLIVVPSPEPQGYAASLRVTERPVYGSSRLGTYARWEELYDHPVVSTPAPDPVQPVDLNYELTDHLGNVAAVVTGRLLNGNGGGTPKQAELVSAQGYEAFGSLLPGRNYSSDSYRFGFNGKENDNEVHQASGTFQDYGMRAYDTRVARFFTVDPIAHRYPMLTPFQFASDSPIEAVDLDGLERFHFTLLQDDQGNSVLRLTGVEDIVDGGLFTYFGMEYLDYVMGIPPLVNDRQEFVIHAYYQPIIPGLTGYETAHKETVFPELAAAMEAVEKGEAGFSAIEKIVQNFETGMGLAMPAEGAGARAGKEIVTKTKSGSRIDAFKLAKEMAGSLGDDAITKSGKIQSQKGRIVGLQSADKTRGWRIDFDPKKNEAHYNWWNGKKNGRVIFEGTQDQVESLINALTKTYNKTD